MLRQISNWIHSGRLRTAAPTLRAGKPPAFDENPILELRSCLKLAAAFVGTAPQDFFFVQIGAFDGRVGDPLFELVQRHRWQGILVEPQPSAFQALRENYADQPQLQFFNVAVGPQEGTLTLYTRGQGGVPTASVSKRLLMTPGHSRSEIQALDVPCWTLERLLREGKAPGRVDLLQIDTEGYDYEIIRSIPFDRCKPTIIRYEHALLSRKDQNACVEFLGRFGYRMLLEDRDTIAIEEKQAISRAA